MSARAVLPKTSSICLPGKLFNAGYPWQRLFWRALMGVETSEWSALSPASFVEVFLSSAWKGRQECRVISIGFRIILIGFRLPVVYIPFLFLFSVLFLPCMGAHGFRFSVLYILFLFLLSVVSLRWTGERAHCPRPVREDEQKTVSKMCLVLSLKVTVYRTENSEQNVS